MSDLEGRLDDAMKRRVVLVAGPSSVGKSTYIRNVLAPMYGIADPRGATVFPANLRTRDAWPTERPLTFFHYNLLRPVHHAAEVFRLLLRARTRWFGAALAGAAGLAGHDVYGYKEDEELGMFFSVTSAMEVRCHLLVADRETIHRRMLRRTHIEPRLGSVEDAVAGYPTEIWTRLLNVVDLHRLYSSFAEELSDRAIACRFVSVD